MKAEIFSIGTELLLGQIIDTNAAFFSEELASLGIVVYYRQTVGDNHARLIEALKESFKRSDLIICSGGLGPTEDDITTECVAKALGVSLYLDENELQKLRNFFTKRGRKIIACQEKQAILPEGCIVIENPTGTAPGFILEAGGKTAIVLPGPPKELIPMWNETVRPYLMKSSHEIIHSLTLRFAGIGEGDLEEALKPLIHSERDVTIAPYAKRGEVHIRLTTMDDCIENANKKITAVLNKIKDLSVGKYIYGYDEDSLEAVVGKLLLKNGLTLAVAESCTGGGLGARITDVSGSSDYFLGGIISYSNEIKEKLLNVNPQTLADFGAVSAETVKEMAIGVCRATKADIGISISGVAGPGGGTEEKPVGTVYIGTNFKDEITSHKLNLWGRRDDIRYRAGQNALQLLYERLTK
jgi:nicotinamide-nucleotide amidase